MADCRAYRRSSANKIVNHSGEGLVRTSCWESSVRFSSGAITKAFGCVTGVNLPSILIAAIGAVPILVVFPR